jgi:O-antigen ligase
MRRGLRDRTLGFLDGAETLGVAVVLAGLTWSEAAKSVGLGLAVAALAARLLLGGGVSFPRRRTATLLALYFGLAALSVALAPPEFARPRELLTLGMTLAAYPLVADVCGRRPSRRVLIAHVLLAGAALGALLGYFEHMAGPYRRLVLPSIENAIPAAEYLAAALAFGAAMLLVDARATVVGPLLGFALGACVLALAMTKSRGPLVGAAVGTLLTGALSLRRRWIVAVAALVLLGSAALFAAGNPGSRVVKGGVVGTRSAENRVTTWKETLDRFAERPIVGHGQGSFALLGIRVVDEVGEEWEQNAHNVILHTLTETGILGAGALVSFLVLGLVDVLRALRRATWRHHRAISVGCFWRRASSQCRPTPNRGCCSSRSWRSARAGLHAGGRRTEVHDG